MNMTREQANENRRVYEEAIKHAGEAVQTMVNRLDDVALRCLSSGELDAVRFAQTFLMANADAAQVAWINND